MPNFAIPLLMFCSFRQGESQALILANALLLKYVQQKLPSKICAYFEDSLARKMSERHDECSNM
jgi:hypothetical protein